MRGVRWFRKSFLKYGAEKYNKIKGIFPFLPLIGRSAGTGTD
jgi:hypothetical protein